MKRLLVVILILLAANSYSQKINEKKIADVQVDSVESYYDFFYDPDNGTYVRMSYDSETDKYFLESNRGKSGEYTYIEFYRLVFDNYGNYYAGAQTYSPESDSKYYLLKNGKEIASYTYLNGNIAIDDDYVYFSATEKDKSFVVKYNFRKEKFENGKHYDYVTLCAHDRETTGEPDITFGFNGAGKLYYIAGSDGNEFMVIGDKEQKKYTSIDIYSVTLDLKGEVCYMGTDENGLYSVTQGNKEYSKFKNIQGPIKFNNENIPVYLASDNEEYTQNPEFIVYGNERGKVSYKGGISDFIISASGKIAFVATESAETDSKSFVVCQGKEGKRYDYIYNLMFTSNDKLIYSGADKELSALVVEEKETGEKYSHIYYVTYSPDSKICYIAQKYIVLPDSSRTEENYYVFGDKVLGPYYDFSYQYEMNYNNLIFDKTGAFAFIASEQPARNDEPFPSKVFTASWSSDAFGLIQSLKMYDKNVYYLASGDDLQTYAFYKNKKRITPYYKIVFNLKYDDDGNVTFTGYRDGAYYYVNIEL